MGYVSDAQRKAVHASNADGGKGNPNKMVSPLDFGAGGASIAGIPTSMFGSLGANPNINSLTNANAMAAQQAAARQTNRMANAAAQPMGSGMIGDMSQNVYGTDLMDPSLSTFNPTVQNIGMGIFGSKGARNRSLFPTPMFKHADEKVSKIKNRIEEIRADYEEERKEGEFYEDAEYGKLMEQLKNIEKEHEKQ